jgi:hypothetical protein
LGIIAEPYFDTDFTSVLYLTDTGRGWNHTTASVRDKVQGLSVKVRGTEELIALMKQGKLPDKIMLNIHPQRWSNSWWLWNYELLAQSLKNVVKRVIASFSSEIPS